MEFGDEKPDEARQKDGELDDTLRRFNILAAMRVRNRVRRVCVESLKLYRQIELDLPQSSRMERYVHVVESRSGADHRAVANIMRLVRKGFALWPAERPLSFRDVVQYIAVTDCLKTEIAAPDSRAGDADFLFDIICEEIPAHL